MKISVITPTCDRPFGIKLCEKYMARQSVQPDEWIVGDGGQTPAPLTMGQTHIHQPKPPGAANLTGNLQAALEAVTGDVLLIMEDDDWYRADHIEKAMQGLVEAPVYGCNWLHYYHVGERRWSKFRNRGSALCQTAMRGDMIGRFRAAVAYARQHGSYGVDGRFWSGLESHATAEQTVVGIKGLPGTRGLGVGHRSHPRVRWQHDPDLSELRRWIGEDAEAYRSCAV